MSASRAAEEARPPTPATVLERPGARVAGRGLSQEEAADRLARYGHNAIGAERLNLLRQLVAKLSGSVADKAGAPWTT